MSRVEYFINVPFQKNQAGYPVYDFEGVEQISQLFEYRLRFVTQQNLSLSQILNQDAAFEIKVFDDNNEPLREKTIFGIVSRLELQGTFDKYFVYFAVLVPKMWRLSLNHQSGVYQKSTLEELISTVMEQGNLSKSGNDFELGLKATLDATMSRPDISYLVQYNESDLNFLNRRLENLGIYYYFQFAGDHAKVFFSDDPAKMIDSGTITHGIFQDPRHFRVEKLRCREKIIPKSICLADYSHAETSKKEYYFDLIEATQDIGFSFSEGVCYEYDTAIQTLKEANYYALVRKEEIISGARICSGRANDPNFHAGYKFKLNNFTPPANWFPQNKPEEANQYLLTRMVSRGTNSANYTWAANVDVVSDPPYQTKPRTAFEIDFQAVPLSNDYQYRPPRITPVPRLSGIMTARVEVDSNNKSYGGDGAFMTEDGEYLVKLPFDRREELNKKNQSAKLDPGEGKRSKPIRLAQPYSGQNYGIHFPNRENTEMVWACLNGNPDRPIGLSTVPNRNNHTPVPNEDLSLGSQNSIEELPGAMGVSATGGIDTGKMSEKVTFGNKTAGNLKNVIRTKRGHQIVMDDNDGSSNVGVTISVGKSKREFFTGKETSSTQTNFYNDFYWNSGISMGGYRKKTILEQVFDSVSALWALIPALVQKRNLPEFLGVVAAFTKEQAATGDTIADTFGDTTPVGISLATDRGVSLSGLDGVNLISPNMFGILGGGLIPGMNSQGYHRLATAVTGFLVNALYGDIIKESIDQVKDYRTKRNEKGWSRTKAFFITEEKKWTAYTKQLITEIMQIPGINLKSAGLIKLGAMAGVNIDGGYKGIKLTSNAHLSQQAAMDINLQSKQGIVIKAEGTPVGEPSCLKYVPEAFSKLKIRAPKVLTVEYIKPKPEECNITLLNEKQSIQLQALEKDIVSQARQRFVVNAEEQDIYQSAGKKIQLDVGALDKESDGTQKDLVKPDAVKTSILLGEKNVDIYANTKIKNAVADKAASNSPAAAIEMTADQIELKCGQSSLILKKDGTINIKGKEVNVSATAGIDMNSQGSLGLNGQNVKIKAKSFATSESQMSGMKGKIEAAVEGTKITINGKALLEGKAGILKLG